VTPFPWTDLAIIVALVVLNGVFAMSELAIVSAKTSALEAKAEAGSTSARIAIGLAANPGKFLSTVQIGITLIGIIAGAYSGASLGGPVGGHRRGEREAACEHRANRCRPHGSIARREGSDRRSRLRPRHERPQRRPHD